MEHWEVESAVPVAAVPVAAAVVGSGARRVAAVDAWEQSPEPPAGVRAVAAAVVMRAAAVDAWVHPQAAQADALAVVAMAVGTVGGLVAQMVKGLMVAPPVAMVELLGEHWVVLMATGSQAVLAEHQEAPMAVGWKVATAAAAVVQEEVVTVVKTAAAWAATAGVMGAHPVAQVELVVMLVVLKAALAGMGQLVAH